MRYQNLEAKAFQLFLGCFLGMSLRNDSKIFDK